MKRRAIAILTVLLAAGSWVRAADPDTKAPSNDQPVAIGTGGKAPGAGLGQDAVVVDEQTEKIIKGSLKWLASKQQANGAWAVDNGQEHQVAMTGYVLMAMMAGGNLPDEGDLGKSVTNGMNFLIGCVKPDGFIQSGNGTNMYEHGIATIALAELYGQSRDARLKAKLESAVKLIISCQNDQGGWRYPPKVGDADISVTVLQCTALRAAKNAGLDVPDKTLDGAIHYVKSCYSRQSGGFSYQPGQAPGFARTAAAIYSLQVCGKYDAPEVKAGSDYLVQHRDDREWYTYGNFYAAPAQYMIGGDTWKKWYETMSKTLIPKAQKSGDMFYWEPFDGGRGVGKVYATAVYTTILAMPYHYIPLYQR